MKLNLEFATKKVNEAFEDINSALKNAEKHPMDTGLMIQKVAEAAANLGRMLDKDNHKPYCKFDNALGQMGQTSTFDLKTFDELKADGWFFCQYSNAGYICPSTGKRSVGYGLIVDTSINTKLLLVKTADCLLYATSNYHGDQVVAFKTEADRNEFIKNRQRFY